MIYWETYSSNIICDQCSLFIAPIAIQGVSIVCPCSKKRGNALEKTGLFGIFVIDFIAEKVW